MVAGRDVGVVVGGGVHHHGAAVGVQELVDAEAINGHGRRVVVVGAPGGVDVTPGAGESGRRVADANGVDVEAVAAGGQPPGPHPEPGPLRRW